MSVSVQQEDFSIEAEIRTLRGDSKDIGAIVSFIGLVRETTPDGAITSMELEHYPGMTERALMRIVEQAETRWPLQAVRVIHRYGVLEPADQIVLVLTASRHRQAAFEAAEYLMDFLKSQAPFWKKEARHAGTQWVDARESDENALSRWSSSET